MKKLNQPSAGNRIQLSQSHQQVRLKLPQDKTANLLVAIVAVGLGVIFIREGLDALQTESVWTGAVIIPGLFALTSVAIAALFLTSRPAYYVDPSGINGRICLQWAVAEIVIQPQALQLQLLTPIQRRWVHIPMSQILRIDRVDRRYQVLWRYQHDRYCILRTCMQDYIISSGLSPLEQDWLITELSELLKHLKTGDR